MSEHDSFVTPNTATSSHNPVDTETFVIRPHELRKRLDALLSEGNLGEVGDYFDAYDIAWLLDRVAELEKRVRMYEVVKS